jgi:hypothetical protein
MLTTYKHSDAEILRELEYCARKNATGGVKDGQAPPEKVEPWWERRITYLRETERKDSLKEYLELRERAKQLIQPRVLAAAA